jgi:hypothetical protein
MDIEETITELAEGLKDNPEALEKLQSIKDHIEWQREENRKAFESRDNAKKLPQELKQQIEALEEEKHGLSKRLKSYTDREDPKMRKELESLIYQASETNSAYNPSQLVDIHKHKFKYDEKEKKWFIPVKDKTTQEVINLSVMEYITVYLKDESNENLIKFEGNTSGTGHRHSNLKSSNEGMKISKEDQVKAGELGLNVEDYLELKPKIEAKRQIRKMR